jgi:hypothetical protein
MVKKAATKVLEPGEELESACMVSLPGTMKSEGRRAMLRSVTGVRIITADDGGLPEKMLAATTNQRVLLFEQSMFARAKGLVAAIPLDQVTSVAATGTSRAQVSLKLLEFAIALKDGQELELESADSKGAEELIRTVSARLT